jgi:hypothetical protein
MSMQQGAQANLRMGSAATPQRVDQLIEEDRDAVIDFGCGRRGHRSRSHFSPATRNDLVAVGGDKFVQHRRIRSDDDRPQLARSLFQKAQAIGIFKSKSWLLA